MEAIGFLPPRRGPLLMGRAAAARASEGHHRQTVLHLRLDLALAGFQQLTWLAVPARPDRADRFVMPTISIDLLLGRAPIIRSALSCLDGILPAHLSSPPASAYPGTGYADATATAFGQPP